MGSKPCQAHALMPGYAAVCLPGTSGALLTSAVAFLAGSQEEQLWCAQDWRDKQLSRWGAAEIHKMSCRSLGKSL